MDATLASRPVAHAEFLPRPDQLTNSTARAVSVFVFQHLITESPVLGAQSLLRGSISYERFSATK